MSQGARLTPEQIEAVAESLENSPAWRAAADAAGIHETTVWRYRQRAESYLNRNTTDDGLQNLQNETDPDYGPYLAVQSWIAARSRLEQQLVLGVRMAIPKDWKAAHAMLKSGWPQDYSDRVELTGAGGGPVQIEAMKSEAIERAEAALQELGLRADGGENALGSRAGDSEPDA